MTSPEGGFDVPERLGAWIERFGGAAAAEGAEGATEAALRALREALERPGRDREGAYALLAADALLTEAAEKLLAADDPDGALRALVARVAAEAAE